MLLGMIAKNAELRPIKIYGNSHENFSKTNGKRLGIAFLNGSAMLNLQLISRFLEFLQGQGERCESEANRSSAKSIKNRKNIGNAIEMPVSFKFQGEKHGNDCKNCRIKTHPTLWQNKHENFNKTNRKRLWIAFLGSAQQCSLCNYCQCFLSFCRVRVQAVRTKPIKISQNLSKTNNEQLAKLSKNTGNIMLLRCCAFHSFKVENMGMIAKNAELRPIKICGNSHENFSKTNGKRLGIAFLSSAQQCSICN